MKFILLFTFENESNIKYKEITTNECFIFLRRNETLALYQIFAQTNELNFTYNENKKFNLIK